MKSNAAILGFAFACALAGGGCSMALDENSVVYSSAPGKYDYLDCKGIAERTEANVKRTAEILNLHRPTLYRKLRSLGLRARETERQI